MSPVYAVAVAITTGEPVGTGDRVPSPEATPGGHRPAGLGSTVALTVTFAAACFLLGMALILSALHPPPGSAAYIGQNQTGKSLLYVGAFGLLLPLWLLAGTKLSDRIAAGRNAESLPALAAALAGALALALVLVRILPVTHHGLHAVLAAVALWSVLAALVLIRTLRPAPWPAMTWLAERTRVVVALAALAVLGALLCVTSLGSVSVPVVAVGAVLALIVVLAWGRISLPALPRAAGHVVDLLVAVLLLGAVTNVVIYHASSGIPNGLVPPGVIQFQQDWILGPTNQLLHGGALLVGDPVSQYGVGLVYFLAAVFHVAPISYATFGLLDGILTSLVYIGAYLTLRLAGVRRLLAMAALALAVCTFVYHLQYPVGSLPELGPLRFGLPMGVLACLTLSCARPRLGPGARLAALIVLGIAAVWSLEGFAYTSFTYLVMVVTEGYLRPPGHRLRWTARAICLGVAACLSAHLILALATLAATGHLPDWSQYLVYVSGLLLGGKEGSVTFGFANWSPGLALGAACLTSAAGLILLLARIPVFARSRPTAMLALAGSTAYGIACFSYTDNRSSTYLFPYVALPVVVAGAIWLTLALRQAGWTLARRRVALAAALSVVVVMVGAAWSTIGDRFSQSALARAYPSGGLSSALDRLWHPPPIDPRSPAVDRLLARYVPGHHVLVVLPDAPDVTMEALMRDHRALSLYLGDPAEDMWNPSVWIPRVARQIDSMPARTRAIVDTYALRMARALRGHPDSYALDHTLPGGNPELEWIIHRLNERFRLRAVHRGPGQFVVVSLLPRKEGG